MAKLTVNGALITVLLLILALFLGVPFVTAGVCTSTGLFCDKSQAMFKRLGDGEGFGVGSTPGRATSAIPMADESLGLPCTTGGKPGELVRTGPAHSRQVLCRYKK